MVSSFLFITLFLVILAKHIPAFTSIQRNPVMIMFYNRLKDKGINGKVIVCAIIQKLVYVISGVQKSGEKYDPYFKTISV
jgi:transposase